MIPSVLGLASGSGVSFLLIKSYKQQKHSVGYSATSTIEIRLVFLNVTGTSLTGGVLPSREAPGKTPSQHPGNTHWNRSYKPVHCHITIFQCSFSVSFRQANRAGNMISYSIPRWGSAPCIVSNKVPSHFTRFALLPLTFCTHTILWVILDRQGHSGASLKILLKRRTQSLESPVKFKDPGHWKIPLVCFDNVASLRSRP